VEEFIESDANSKLLFVFVTQQLRKSLKNI